MEINITHTVDVKRMVSRFRENLNAFGFLTQDNVIHMCEQKGIFPVMPCNRKDVVFAFTRNIPYLDDVINYLRNIAFAPNTYVICNDENKTSNEQIKSVCRDIGIPFFSTSVDLLLSDDVHIYKIIFLWMMETSAKEVSHLKELAEEYHDLSTKITVQDFDGSLEKRNSKNPYIFYFFQKKIYGDLSQKHAQACKENNRCKMNHLEEAFGEYVTVLERKAKSFPSFTRLYLLIAFVYQFKLSKLSEAVPFYKKALQLSQKHAYTPYYLASILQTIDAHKYQELIREYYNASIQNNPICYQSYFKLGKLAETIGDLDMALQHYKSVREILAYSEKNGYLTQDENNYLWKAHYFPATLYNSGRYYRDALFHVNELIRMKQENYLIGDDMREFEEKGSLERYLFNWRSMLEEKGCIESEDV